MCACVWCGVLHHARALVSLLALLYLYAGSLYLHTRALRQRSCHPLQTACACKVAFLGRVLTEILTSVRSAALVQQEILQFQDDRSPEVRKQVVAFVEAACKKDAGLLPRVCHILHITRTPLLSTTIECILNPMCPAAIARVLRRILVRTRKLDRSLSVL